MENFIIYSATYNVDGRKYIGTTNNLKRRIANHYAPSNKGPFQTLLRSVPKSDITWEVLETVTDSKLSYEREKFWIENFKTYLPSKGFNISMGGMKNKIYDLYHPIFGTISGNLKELAIETGIHRNSISFIIKKKIIHQTGWCLLELKSDYNSILNSNLQYGGKGNLILEWNHNIYGYKKCSAKELLKIDTSLKKHNVKNLLNGKIKKTNGWTLLSPLPEKYYKTWSYEIYSLEFDKYFTGTVRECALEIGISEMYFRSNIEKSPLKKWKLVTKKQIA